MRALASSYFMSTKAELPSNTGLPAKPHIRPSIETTCELWASSLREVKKRIRPLFAQERAALNAGLFVDGLLGDERRKTGWMRAEAAGDPGPKLSLVLPRFWLC
jgi:hypothetical protein